MEEVEVQIPLVDEWQPNENDIIFTNAKNVIICPVDQFFHLVEGSNQINLFWVNSKKGYNSEDIRNHYCHYMNYFEKYFDPEKEYFTNLANMKYLIDCYKEYDDRNFMTDIVRYIIQPSLYQKISNMVEYNYHIVLSYKANNNPQLQYTNHHGKVLMMISIMMNLCIPLITHFAYKRRVNAIDEFILDVYDYILYAPQFNNDVNIHTKLYETAFSNVSRNEQNNPKIWIKQDIRGKDTVIHSEDSISNIIINIIPKYCFNQIMINLNYTSIQKSNKYQITDIKYEFSFVPLSSSKRDGEDNTSEFD